MRRAVLVVLSAAALVAAGCTTKSDGDATPTGSTSTTASDSTTTQPSEASDVPAITGPELDLSRFAGPCELLQADQLSARGVTKPGTQRTDPAGPACQWRPDDRVDGTSFSVVILEKSKGLEGFYENRGSSGGVFEPTEVAGYPAVNSDATDAKSGACSTAVGVAKGEGFMVQTHVNDETLPEYTNPCSISGAVAETIVANLKG
ncbi:DUF3558 domain-containing protein [Saccharothrix sp. HUAS TT1]|uniref:DUF3558 domain-containing protein n=1 Tax=unclassified Saccharothrix TaxID=2593673 RepID=UPI00345BD4BA